MRVKACPAGQIKLWHFIDSRQVCWRTAKHHLEDVTCLHSCESWVVLGIVECSSVQWGQTISLGVFSANYAVRSRKKGIEFPRHHALWCLSSLEKHHPSIPGVTFIILHSLPYRAGFPKLYAIPQNSQWSEGSETGQWCPSFGKHRSQKWLPVLSKGSLSLCLSAVLPPPPLFILTSTSSKGWLCQALSTRISGPWSQGSYIVVEATDKEAEQASHGTQGK